MFIKLAFRNVKRSFQNYAIYFFTIAFGICVFYIFNSIESQAILFEINQYQFDMIKVFSFIITIISVFVLFILAFLILYANRFLLKTRTKELAVYLTLGMEKKQVVSLILFETIGIGFLALLFGLFTGIFFSQALSAVTAYFFDFDMKEFRFVFSASAFFKTIFYFMGIIIVSAFCNIRILKRNQLLELFSYSKKNELVSIKSSFHAVLLGTFSIISILTAYFLVLKQDIFTSNTLLLTSILLGTIGTFGFFRSLSSFFLLFFQKQKKIYYRNLNMFLLKQLNYNIHSASISISIICLMLFLSISALSTGFGVSHTLSQIIESSTPYDATFTVYEKEPLLKELEAHDLNVSSFTEKQHEFYLYKSDFLLEGMDDFLNVIKVSDYNKAANMQGKAKVILEKQNFLFLTTLKEKSSSLKKQIKENQSVQINGTTLTLQSEEIKVLPLETTFIPSSALLLIVPDTITENLDVSQTILNLTYFSQKQTAEQQIENWKKNRQDGFYRSVYTKINTIESNRGMAAMFSYIAVYIGLIFLICSAAILALQQLYQTAENIIRYELLKKLGVSVSMLWHTNIMQIGIYFLLPLLIAIIHSSIALKVSYSFITKFGLLNNISYLIGTAAFLVIIYGGYFVLTCFSAKNICKKTNRIN